MSPPDSELFTVEDIPGAGCGVVAKQFIPKGALVLKSNPPSTHVIFWEYRKEVCAQCFHYDRGRKLPIRLNSAGKVFCGSECKSKWLEEQGRLGVTSWEELHKFLQLKSKTLTNRASFPLLAAKPVKDEVETSWEEAEKAARQTRDSRTRASLNPVRDREGKTQGQQIHRRAWTQAEDVDPDILGYLLSGALLHHKRPGQWHSMILPLAMDETPYRTTMDLSAHCDSFLQLAGIVPIDILTSATSHVCQTSLNAASHNSFGIRSEDGEEYLGYALYPESSYFNHSCAPNISKKRLGSVWEFCALRDIDVGKECCITYLGGDEEELTVGGRKEHLKRVWGFECMCVRCKQESLQ